MGYGSILNQSFETSPVLDNYFTKDESLTNATAAQYGLGAAAVPDDVLATARSLITTAQATADNALGWTQIGTASLAGESGASGATVSFSITLSKSLSTVKTLLIVVEDYQASYYGNTGTANLYFDSIQYFPNSGTSGTAKAIQISSSSMSGSAGQAMLYIDAVNLDLYAFPLLQYQYYYKSGPASGMNAYGCTFTQKANTISGHISFSSGETTTINSGSIKVYARV